MNYTVDVYSIYKTQINYRIRQENKKGLDSEKGEKV